MQVSCRCKHAPWHLGANAKSLSAQLIEDPSNYIVMSRSLGATRCCSKFTWLYLQSPCSLLHNDPALGGYTGWKFLWASSNYKSQVAANMTTRHLGATYMEYSVLRWTNRISSRLKHLLEQVLSYHYVLLLRLGGYRYYAYKGGISSNYQFLSKSGRSIT